MVTITALEFQRNFGRYRETAQREAVSVTNHGRESVVLISSQEYRRLMARERRAVLASEFSAADTAALDAVMFPAEGDEFNHEYPPNPR